MTMIEEGTVIGLWAVGCHTKSIAESVRVHEADVERVINRYLDRKFIERARQCQQTTQ